MSYMTRILVALTLLAASFAIHAESIDLNSADAVSIAQVLDGIGHSKADAIVAYRETNGPFNTLEDLEKVKGIGKKTIELNRSRIRLKSASR